MTDVRFLESEENSVRIADLLKKESIDLQARAADKAGAIDHLVGLMEKGGHLKDTAAYKACVLARESVKA